MSAPRHPARRSDLTHEAWAEEGRQMGAAGYAGVAWVGRVLAEIDVTL
ncbi:MAG: hypothetical protein HYZ91_04255 [Candidatus Omnitrophica bacterium]|nr:hypothetical protein [Candidatus Omnitrophota bacterium]